MDPTIIGALISAVAVIVATAIPLLLKSRKKRRYSAEDVQDTILGDKKLDTILFVVLGDGWLGPIKMGLYSNDKPDTMISEKMNGPLELPKGMKTKGQRKLFWKEGNRFLQDNVTYGEQGVRTGNTLMLTDQVDSGMASALLETALNMPNNR